MAKSYLTQAELDALAPATNAQIEEIERSLITDIVENDIDDRKYKLPNMVVPMLQVMKRLDQVEAALLKLIYTDDNGRWFIGIIGDTDVTEIVGPSIALMNLDDDEEESSDAL